MFLNFQHLSVIICKMPWPKATQYKRFNVGQYMNQKHLQNEKIEEKSKKVEGTVKRLKRLEERVSFLYIADSDFDFVLQHISG